MNPARAGRSHSTCGMSGTDPDGPVWAYGSMRIESRHRAAVAG